MYALAALALFGMYSAALYKDNTYGILVPVVVQVVPGLFVLILVGVPIKAPEAFADASLHAPAATYVFGVVRFICVEVSETATRPAPVPVKAP